MYSEDALVASADRRPVGAEAGVVEAAVGDRGDRREDDLRPGRPRQRSASDEAEAPRSIRIPVSQLAMRAPRIDCLLDVAATPMRSRLRDLSSTWQTPGEETLSMATMVRAADGGHLRLQNVMLGHEHGRYASFKAGRPLVWEGTTHLAKIIHGECSHEALSIGTESVRFEIPIMGRLVRYTVDVELRLANGRLRLIEMKRDERDLEDPEYRLVLATVAEICRRCDIEFEIVLRDEIFASRRHRMNCELFASRAFTAVEPIHERRLDAHATERRGETTYGDLAAALDPARPVGAQALVQALTIRRRVEIDLSQRITVTTPIRIH